MTAGCSVCNHPRLSHIDRLIVAGNRSLASIAAEVGVHYSALRRHTAKHVARPAVPPANAPTTSGGGLPAGSSPVAVMRKTVDDLAAIDASKLPPAQRVAHLDALRRATESLARMEPPAAPDSVRIEDVEGLAPFLADVFLALEPYPDARKALGAVIEKHGATLGASSPSA